MNSKTFAFTVTAILSASALFAEPRVDQSAVTLAQDSQSRLVTVGYELTGEPAVITVDFQTNTLANAAGDWVSIGDVNFTNVVGDVNQVVQTGSRTITWQPDKSWPGQRINDGRVRAVVKAWATNAPPDYCAVCLLSDADIQTRQETDVTFNPIRRRYFVSSNAVPGGVQNRMYKTEYLLLRKIHAAGVVWRMGSPESEYDRTAARELPHKVSLTRDYYIGVYEITQSQFSRLYGSNPSQHKGDEYPDSDVYPVGKIGWSLMRGSPDTYTWPGNGHSVDDAKYIGLLRGRSGIESFDIPTEAQWEYACRAGTGTAYGNGGLNDKDARWGATPCEAMAWYTDNCETNGVKRVHSVGEKEPNAWNLYDMHGNASEWCLDWLADVNEAVTNAVSYNPGGPETGSQKVLRGGGYSSNRIVCRSACRSSIGVWGNDSPTGFRVVCDGVAK